MAIFAKRGQIVKAIVFPRGRIFAVMNLQTLLPVANAATPAVAVDGFPPQFFPLRRLNISGITARTTNGFFIRRDHLIAAAHKLAKRSLDNLEYAVTGDAVRHRVDDPLSDSALLAIAKKNHHKRKCEN